METLLEQQRRYHEERERLADTMTKEMLYKKSSLAFQGKTALSYPKHSFVGVLFGPSKYDKILAAFPELTNPSLIPNELLNTKVLHYIETKGPPVFPVSHLSFLKFLVKSLNSLGPKASYALLKVLGQAPCTW
ncbi:hypothetical protein JTE90_011405 [Oedothorax gibbosus]|uniref:Uncharacterized protein n=1 Tax=Oedothorax gibbosus TaxID=931172 RepID=A0AAV6U6W5_9ARAC|nr:hypothetical protein JTE90_011405 [Oedothorax gibbosus]